MADNQYVPFLIYILCAMHFVWFFVEAGWLIVHYKEQQDKSRIFAGLASLYGAIGSLMFIVTAMSRGDLEGFTKTILEPYPVMLTTIPVLLLMLYLTEIERPHWMTLKRLFFIMLPWMALSMAWIIYHGVHHWQFDAVTHMTSYEQIPANIHKTDVLLRVLLAAIHLPYGFAILFVRHDPEISNVSAVWPRWLKIMSAISSVTFLFGMSLRIRSAMFAHFIILDILFVLVFVFEAAIRNRATDSRCFEQGY